MAEKIVSPGVFTNEIDQSFLPAAIGDIGAAIIGPTVKGPAFVPTVVSSYSEYVQIFGELYESASQNFTFLTSHAAKEYLRHGNTLTVCRIMSGSTYAEATASVMTDNTVTGVNTATGSLTLVTVATGEVFRIIDSETTHSFVASVDGSGDASDGSVRFFPKGATAAAMAANLVTEVNAEAPKGVVASSDGALFIISGAAAGTGNNGIIFQTASNASPGTFGTNAATKFTTEGGTDTSATGTEAFQLITHGQGAVLNSGPQSGNLDDNGVLTNGTDKNIRWEVNGVSNRKGTFNLVIRQGNDTTKRKTILETWNNLSMDPNAKNYIASVIGDSNNVIKGTSPDKYLQPSGAFPNKSAYVRVKVNVDNLTPNYLDNAGQTSSADYTASLPQENSGAFVGGNDGKVSHPMKWYDEVEDTNIQGISLTGDGYGGYKDALDLLGNPDEYDINLIMLPGVINDMTNGSKVIDYAIQKAEDRADCLVIADPTSYAANLTTAVTQAEGYDSNYAAMYYPWCQVLDNSTGQYRWVPPSTVMGGVYAFNDKVAQPWFAPAGLNRGGLDGVIQTERKLTHANRDTLYEGNVNPIATFPGQGICAWGQKTLQKKSSALDRINVRRLLIRVKKFIASSSRFLVFEQNNAATRTRFLNIVNPFLENVQSQSGLNAFKVVMDDTNNTPDVVDRNILYGQLFLQPTKTAEFIVLDFVVQPTGAAFPE